MSKPYPEKNGTVSVEEFPYGSEAYRDACVLRHVFLRVPLGLELTAADKADDATQLHFGLFSTDDSENRFLIGGCIGKPVEGDEARTIQFRQVVIDEAWRSRGLGIKLMLEAEKLLGGRGFTRFILYARDEAIPFYERCGYQQEGKILELIGLPHFLMVK